MADRGRHFAERESSVDRGCDLLRLDQLAQDGQVLRVLRGDERAELLADESRKEDRPDLAVGAAE